MLPLIAASLAIAFFIMVRMGVFGDPKDTGSKGRGSRSAQARRLLGSPTPEKGEDERLEVFEDFIDRLRGSEGDDGPKSKKS